jgi:hypothetical protein
MRRASVAVAFLIAFACGLGACGGGGDTTASAMGSGDDCRNRLSSVLTSDYLLQHGLAIGNRQVASTQAAQAVDSVCRKGPPTLSVSKGAERVVRLINRRFAR